MAGLYYLLCFKQDEVVYLVCMAKHIFMSSFYSFTGHDGNALYDVYVCVHVCAHLCVCVSSYVTVVGHLGFSGQ